MATCPICKQDIKILHGAYQGVRIRPPRCYSCIHLFPPAGVTSDANDFRRTRRWMPKYKFHQWAIIAQDGLGESWLCLRCKKAVSSPGLGYPKIISCHRGTEKTLKNVFWAHRTLKVVCPKCHEPPDPVDEKTAEKYRMGKMFMPYLCTNRKCV